MVGKRREMRTLGWLGVGAVILLSVVTIGGLVGLRLNVSKSVPYGIYRLTDSAPEIGSLVTFCVPDRLAHLDIFQRATVDVCIKGQGTPLLKRVASIDRQTGGLIVAGDTARSIDSRWFGPLFKNEIISTAKPVWTFGG